MKINKEELNRCHWYEDANGNIIDVDVSDNIPDDMEGVTYHSLFPLEITEHISEWCWHPRTRLQKFLCKFRPLYRYLRKKHRAERTYRHLISFSTNIGGGNQDVIMAMVNSGDYTLSQALRLWSQSCERCMNVIAHTYLDGADGYAEYSEEWKKCNTVCNFCREEREEK